MILQYKVVRENRCLLINIDLKMNTIPGTPDGHQLIKTNQKTLRKHEINQKQCNNVFKTAHILENI